MKKANSHFQSEIKVNILPDCKRSQSQIIATILLILLAISAAAIIGAFATNFVKDQLKETDCFDVVDKLEISNHPQYTCYDKLNNNMLVQVHLLDAEIEGFILEIGGDSTTAYTIKDKAIIPQIGMYRQAKGTALQLPGKNEERTYNITSPTKPNITAIYPIIKGGKTCDESDSIMDPINC